MGRPLPGYRIALLDADGLESDHGEIALPLRPRPAGLMRGYQNDAGEPAPIEGPYYRTGDVASRDAEGYITYIGRADDVFKSSDYRLSPFELESALIEHEAVAEAAVVPAPDPVRLTTPRPMSCSRPASSRTEATAASIFDHVRRAALALQARAAHRVRRAAEDRVGQDPPRRTARPRDRARRTRGAGGSASSGSRISRRGRTSRRFGAPGAAFNFAKAEILPVHPLLTGDAGLAALGILCTKRAEYQMLDRNC